jgi:hypothetical protein
MGSKALLFGAISLIVGVYAISLKNVQVTGMQTAQSHVNRVQKERLVDAALSLALDDVQKNGSSSKTVTGRHALGGPIDYTVIHETGTTAEIDITVNVGGNGNGRVVVAQVEQAKKKSGFRKVHRGDWRVLSVFVKKG